MESSRPGTVWSLLNAALQEQDNCKVAVLTHATSACSRVLGSALLQFSPDDDLRRPISCRIPPHHPVHSASISRAAANILDVRSLVSQWGKTPKCARNTFFEDIFKCPNNSFFATLSTTNFAGAVARSLVVSVGDKLTLQGIRLDKTEVAALGEDTIRSFFNELDENKDGIIETDELLRLLQRMGLPTHSAYLRDLVEQYNTDLARPTVTYDSFQKYISRQNAKLHRAFSLLNVDGTGVITQQSLLTGLQAMGLPAEDTDARRMIRLLDSSKDNCVTYMEFCRFACLLPAAQVNNDNVAFCWVDSTDYLNGVEYRLCMTPPKQTYQRLLAGGVAGAISRTMVAPLERLRTIMMASCPPMTMPQSVAAMWADGAWRGMFKGNMATVVKVLPASAVQFAVYDSVKDILKSVVPRAEGSGTASWERLLAGCIAGVSSSVITYPLETIRTLMSMPKGMTGGFLDVATSTLRQRGMLGLYRGYSSAIINEALGTGLGFLAYETGNQMWERCYGCKPDAKQKGLVGALSAVVVMTATMPFELIMRRMQVLGTLLGAQFQYSGTFDAMRQIILKEGFGAFYRGSVFSYAKVVPSIGAMYMFYELINRTMAIGGLRSYTQDHHLLRERRKACEDRQTADRNNLLQSSKRLATTV